jgi:hypothetical protein
MTAEDRGVEDLLDNADVPTGSSPVGESPF